MKSHTFFIISVWTLVQVYYIDSFVHTNSAAKVQKNCETRCYSAKKTYYHLHRLRTVRGIIRRWAPSNENNTQAYIKAMCKEVGLKPDEYIEMSEDFWIRFLDAMIYIENGVRVERWVIEAVVKTYYDTFKC